MPVSANLRPKVRLIAPLTTPAMGPTFGIIEATAPILFTYLLTS